MTTTPLRPDGPSRAGRRPRRSTAVGPAATAGRARWGWGAAALTALSAAVVAGLSLGPAGIPASALLADLLSRLPLGDLGEPLPALDRVVLWEIRAPRVALGALAGGILALAGGAYQAVFRNPLADPYLLGVSSGAGLGATAVIAYVGVTSLLLPGAAFAGAVLAVSAAYLLGRSARGEDGTASLLLAGVAVAAFLGALQTFVLQQNSESVRSVYAWLLGRLSTSGWTEVLLVLPYVAVSAAVILLCRHRLDVLRVGDDEATALGVRVGRLRLAVVAAATLGTAAAVAVSGLIGFVGIVVPHVVRLLAGSSYRTLLPLAAAFGAAFLVLADAVARTVLSPAELPIGVVTAVVGAPFFALVLRSARRSGA